MSRSPLLAALTHSTACIELASVISVHLITPISLAFLASVLGRLSVSLLRRQRPDQLLSAIQQVPHRQCLPNQPSFSQHATGIVYTSVQLKRPAFWMQHIMQSSCALSKPVCSLLSSPHISWLQHIQPAKIH